jgi:tRNA(Ile)-lysidine synthase
MDRNFLRLRVVPLLRARWPAAAVTVGRSARHLAEAQGLLARCARAALAAAADGAALRVSALRALNEVDRRNALRYWIQARGLRTPDHRRLAEIAGPMLAARADASPIVRWRGAQVRRHGDRLVAHLAEAAPGSPAELAWDWRAEPQLALPAGGAIALLPDAQGEVSLSALPCPLRVCFRRGGERLAQSGGHLALKDLLQQRGIEPWLRAAVPLLASGERILAVADLWLDLGCRVRAADRSSAHARLRWRRPNGDGD